MKVLLGLSGGVDSAVAARLLLEEGHEVIGCYLDNGLPGAEEARAAAAALSIPFCTRDIRTDMEERVCSPFAAAYLRGETPNPCILCNPAVKFPALLAEAERLGAEKIATGHYARCENGRLFKGRSPNDQSYMLCRLSRAQVERLLLPLGPYNKEEVRALARERRLAAADKRASMEICFIPDGDYAGYIEKRGLSPAPGPYVYHGQVVGQHKGIHHFTLGQRRHLGIAVGQRVYVSDIRPDSGEVVLSDAGELWADRIRVRDIRWLSSPSRWPVEATVRIRHSRQDSPPALIEADGRISFASPVRAPTPGQAAAFYAGEELLGGGFIEKGQ